MKKLKNISPIIAAIIFMLLIVIVSTCALRAQDYGYLIVVDYANGDTKANKTMSIDLVNQSFYNHLKQNYDIGYELANNTFAQHRNNNIIWYVEKRIVVRNKRGKLKYRKINKVRVKKEISKKNITLANTLRSRAVG